MPWCQRQNTSTTEILGAGKELQGCRSSRGGDKRSECEQQRGLIRDSLCPRGGVT